MENINWTNYSDESIDFILSQAEKLLDETFKSFRETINKSYGALAIYISILSFCLNKIANENTFYLHSIIPYFVLIIGLIFSICTIWYNLLPSKMSFPGSQPRELVQPWFEKFKESKEQIRKYKIAKIEDYDNGVLTNRNEIAKRLKYFKVSLKYLFFAFICSFVTIVFFRLFCS